MSCGCAAASPECRIWPCPEQNQPDETAANRRRGSTGQEGWGPPPPGMPLPGMPLGTPGCPHATLGSHPCFSPSCTLCLAHTVPEGPQRDGCPQSCWGAAPTAQTSIGHGPQGAGTLQSSAWGQDNPPGHNTHQHKHAVKLSQPQTHAGVEGVD